MPPHEKPPEECLVYNEIKLPSEFSNVENEEKLLFSKDYYPIDNINNTNPKIIKTNDGGFLINSSYSNYNDQGVPIEGSSRYRLIKTDVQGNEE